MAISAAFSLKLGAGPKLTELALSYCGHFPASPFQPPNAQNDIYDTTIEADPVKYSCEDGKGTDGTQLGPTQYVNVVTNPLGNKGLCDGWMRSVDINSRP